jgi:hypothetical protein
MALSKGKVERTVGIMKNGFWAGVHFTDLDDLNEQASTWCDRLNQKMHRTTLRVPIDMWVEENLMPLRHPTRRGNTTVRRSVG